MDLNRLSNRRYSPDLAFLCTRLSSVPRFLIIQDLDGVCMGLVRNPLDRKLAPDYIEAARNLAGQFYVLTNGEHLGMRGVNPLVERAMAKTPSQLKQEGMYLPGLGAGGVQWQDRFGDTETPGISDTELAFLKELPAIFSNELQSILVGSPLQLDEQEISRLASVMILDNPLSPTININAFASVEGVDWQAFLALQKAVEQIMQDALNQAQDRGLDQSFFVHYAPNLGRGTHGEIVKWADDDNLGTTDFQLMLQGAVKEVGVLVILNRYYYHQTGQYPLGESFNARSAPKHPEELLALAESHFDPALMPVLIGVGDTVTSARAKYGIDYQRGGSDRGFLEVVQGLGKRLGTEAATVFVDSSQGELNRPRVDCNSLGDPDNPWQGLEGISDPEDPLMLNFVVPGGFDEYTRFFVQLSDS